MRISIEPVGYVRGGRTGLDDDYWGGSIATVELVEPFGTEALAELGQFSHLEVVFLFDRVDPETVETGARRPRSRQDRPLVGIFAQRGKRRPNRLGVSRCRILAVDGVRVRVEGLDAVDGTPVVDLKPWMDEFGPIGPTRQPPWADELMSAYYAPPATAQTKQGT